MGFTAARKKVAAGDAIYHGRISRSVQRMEHDEETGMDPAKAGAYIAEVIDKILEQKASGVDLIK